MWKVNGVSRHKLEITQFLNDNHIDIMLLVDTHLTNKYNFQIRGYTFYRTDHPDGKAHGGTGILISTTFIKDLQLITYKPPLSKCSQTAETYNHTTEQQIRLCFPWQPTYWPTDPRKVPDLIDFTVAKNIPRNIISAKALSDLSSDHSLLTLLQSTKTTDHPLRLTSHRTNWLKYKKYVSSHIQSTPHFNIESNRLLYRCT